MPEPFKKALCIKEKINIVPYRNKSPEMTIEIEMLPIKGNNEDADRRLSYEIMTAAFGYAKDSIEEAASCYVDTLKLNFYSRLKEYEEYVALEQEDESYSQKKFDRFEALYSITGETGLTAYGHLYYILKINRNGKMHYKALTFDPETGKRVTLDDIFTGNYREKLKELMFENYFRYSGSPYSNAGEVPLTDNFQILSNTIDFLYDAPNEYGCIKIKVKYSALDGMLKLTPIYSKKEKEEFWSRAIEGNYGDNNIFVTDIFYNVIHWSRDIETDYADKNIFVTDIFDNVIYWNNSIRIEEWHRIDTTDLNSPVTKLRIDVDFPKANNDTATEKISRFIVSNLFKLDNVSLLEACISVRDSIVSNMDFEEYYSEAIIKGYRYEVSGENKEIRFLGWNIAGYDSICKYSLGRYEQNDGSGLAGGVYIDNNKIYHFNAETGELIELNELFKEGYETELRSIAEDILLNEMNFTEEVYRQRRRNDILNSYNISEDTLTLYMNFYYMGYQREEIKIPYERIKYLLK